MKQPEDIYTLDLLEGLEESSEQDGSIEEFNQEDLDSGVQSKSQQTNP